MCAAPLSLAAHDIPNDVTIQAFLKPESGRLHLLMRVPLKAIRDINFPERGQGYLDLAQTDALLAGGVDILNTGTGNLLLLWDRTRGGVKGIVATSAQPMTLISRDPNIKSIKDSTPIPHNGCRPRKRRRV